MRHETLPKGARALLCKFKHAVDAAVGLPLNLGRHLNFSAPLSEALQDSFQPIHGHPRTLCAALASGAFAGGRGLNQMFTRGELPHAME
jgi:hypothetical protein